MARRQIVLPLLGSLVLFVPTGAFDAHKFKKCADNAFCRTHRAFADEVRAAATDASAAPEHYALSGVSLADNVLRGVVRSSAADAVPLALTVTPLLDGRVVRVHLVEEEPLHPRFEVPGVVDAPAPSACAEAPPTRPGTRRLDLGGDMALEVDLDPLALRLEVAGEAVVVVNGGALLKYEHYRPPSPNASETFQSHTDTKPRGPASLGVDVAFPGAASLHGLPEHAAAFALADTRGDGARFEEPYRLFNLDVFEYDLDSPFGLYGSVPFVLARRGAGDRAAGALWLNAAEMYADVRGTAVHWFAESGVVDLFLFAGPTHAQVVQDHTALAGRPFLPPLWAVAYHQCRWNYNDEADVRAVDAGFEARDFPYDVIWLDIEHTDGKRYFTWDARKFPDPARMQEDLAARGHRTVVIIDPHIKVDKNYEVYADARAADLFVHTHGGDTFEGWCWPGTSSYLDFVREDVRTYWAGRVQPEKYAGSTKHLFVWNDMNEPSVFNGPEVTMQKDCLHDHGRVEHRDVHNLYGQLQARATFEGLLAREPERPFVLSRAFFIGSQRYGAVWTGDNMARWDHLRATVPMLLSLGIAGITFAGADVGGFFGNPDAELLVRWYQAGAYQPFFRAHAHIETKRREPWLFDDASFRAMRAAVVERYALLPYVYTAFAVAAKRGWPVMRPLWWEGETGGDPETAYFFGPALLIAPVTEAGAAEVRMEPPLAGAYYDARSGAAVDPSAALAAPLHRGVPVLQRAGTILARRDRVRRSSDHMARDPYTLVVAPDAANAAEGQLYLDDEADPGGSHEWRTFTLTGLRLASRRAEGPGAATAGAVEIERIVIFGWTSPAAPRVVRCGEEGSRDRDVTFYVHDGVLTLRKVGVRVGTDWACALEL